MRAWKRFFAALALVARPGVAGPGRHQEGQHRRHHRAGQVPLHGEQGRRRQGLGQLLHHRPAARSPVTTSIVIAFYGKADVIISQSIKDDADKTALQKRSSHRSAATEDSPTSEMPWMSVKAQIAAQGERTAGEVRPPPDGRHPGGAPGQQVLLEGREVQPRVPRQHEDHPGEGLEGHGPRASAPTPRQRTSPRSCRARTRRLRTTRRRAP